MAWIWSDELADAVRDDPSIPRALVDQWQVAPFALSWPTGSDLVLLARRLVADPRSSTESVDVATGGPEEPDDEVA